MGPGVGWGGGEGDGGGGVSFSFSFFLFLKKVFLSRETAARTILEEVGKGGGRGAGAETVGATGGQAATAGTAAGGAQPSGAAAAQARTEDQPPPLPPSGSRRLSSGCSWGPDRSGGNRGWRSSHGGFCVCAAPRAGTGTGVRGCSRTSTAGAGPPLPDSIPGCPARRQMLGGGW